MRLRSLNRLVSATLALSECSRVVKLCLGREKDLELVKALLNLKKLECAKLRERFALLPLGEKELFRAGRNLGSVCPAR